MSVRRSSSMLEKALSHASPVTPACIPAHIAQTYHSRGPHELNAIAGDLVLVLFQAEGWAYVCDMWDEYREGYVPLTFCDIIDSDNDHKQKVSNPGHYISHENKTKHIGVQRALKYDCAVNTSVSDKGLADTESRNCTQSSSQNVEIEYSETHATENKNHHPCECSSASKVSPSLNSTDSQAPKAREYLSPSPTAMLAINSADDPYSYFADSTSPSRSGARNSDYLKVLHYLTQSAREPISGSPFNDLESGLGDMDCHLESVECPPLSPDRRPSSTSKTSPIPIHNKHISVNRGTQTSVPNSPSYHPVEDNSATNNIESPHKGQRQEGGVGETLPLSSLPQPHLDKSESSHDLPSLIDTNELDSHADSAREDDSSDILLDSILLSEEEWSGYQSELDLSGLSVAGESIDSCSIINMPRREIAKSFLSSSPSQHSPTDKDSLASDNNNTAVPDVNAAKPHQLSNDGVLNQKSPEPEIVAEDSTKLVDGNLPVIVLPDETQARLTPGPVHQFIPQQHSSEAKHNGASSHSKVHTEGRESECDSNRSSRMKALEKIRQDFLKLEEIRLQYKAQKNSQSNTIQVGIPSREDTCSVSSTYEDHLTGAKYLKKKLRPYRLSRTSDSFRSTDSFRTSYSFGASESFRSRADTASSTDSYKDCFGVQRNSSKLYSGHYGSSRESSPFIYDDLSEAEV